MRKTLKQRVVELLQDSRNPMTDDEIASALRLNSNSVRPRRIELEQDGVVVAAGMVRTKSNRRAYVWTVSANNRA